MSNLICFFKGLLKLYAKPFVEFVGVGIAFLVFWVLLSIVVGIVFYLSMNTSIMMMDYYISRIPELEVGGFLWTIIYWVIFVVSLFLYIVILLLLIAMKDTIKTSKVWFFYVLIHGKKVN